MKLREVCNAVGKMFIWMESLRDVCPKVVMI